jgi:hypothetical protein
MPADTPPLRPKKPCAMPAMARFEEFRINISTPLCHRPLYAGDPFFFFGKRNWVARIALRATGG